MNRLWRLDSPSQSLVFHAADEGLPEITYWGPVLPEGEDLPAFVAAARIDVTGGMLDANPPLSICPEASRSFPGQPGMALRGGDGTLLSPRFRLDAADEHENSLGFEAQDDRLGLIYNARFGVDAKTGLIMCEASLNAKEPIWLDWLSAPILPAPQYSDEMIDFSGRWCGEFEPIRSPWSAGIRQRESRTGRTGHEHFPGLIIPASGTPNTRGEAWALHYGWSGGHRMIAEELPDGRRQIHFGHAASTEREARTSYNTGTLYLAFSESGLNVVVWPKPEAPRPVHYNCWEAVYFDHSVDELKDIATRAAALGAERFVLDDGWFGRRDDDTSSLGDWTVDARKYPDGLNPLIEHVRAKGMSFGLWFEPEMVNPDSDLYRAHPDWALGPADQTLGRQQMVLDMANEAVRDYLFERIGALLSGYAIEYIKWDHNRVLPEPDAAQTRGTYALLGSHVGPRRCHTSGRVLDIRFRAWVAAQRHMGFEMDPRELTDEEAQVLREVTAWWKANRDWMARADILRLDSADPAVIAEQQLAEDGGRFVVFAGKSATSVQIAPRPLRLTGLERDARYRIDLINRGDAHPLSRGDQKLKSEPLSLTGGALMQQGLALPWSFPETMWVIEGTRL